MIEETGERSWLWEKLEDTGFSERVNHAVAGCTEKGSGRRLMFSIGGFNGRGIVRNKYERWNDLGDVPLDMLQFDVDAREWTQIYPPHEHSVATGASTCTPPPSSQTEGQKDYLEGRYAHSICCYKNRIYMYGGRNDYHFFPEVECYDLATGKWTVCKVIRENEDVPQPLGRYAHACSLNGPIMYIQGGTVSDHFYRLSYTTELSALNLETLVWKTESTAGEDMANLARDFHSGVYVNGRFVVFGGKCHPPNEDNDEFFEYDFSTHKWCSLVTTGYHPPGRRSLQAVRYGDHSIIYFGGFSTRKKIFYSDLFVLDTATRQVTKIEPYGIGPCPRRRVGMCLLGSELVICGGVGRIEKTNHHSLATFSDSYILHLVPSLQQIAIQFIIKDNTTTHPLPPLMQQRIQSIKEQVYSNMQELEGALTRPAA